MKMSFRIAFFVALLLSSQPRAWADSWVGTFNDDWFFQGNWYIFDGPPGVGESATLARSSDGVFPITRTDISLSASTTIASLNVFSPLGAQYTITGSNSPVLTATTSANFENEDLQALNVHTLLGLRLNTPRVSVNDNAILSLGSGAIITTDNVQLTSNGRVDVNSGASVQTLKYQLDNSAGEIRVNSGGELRIAGDTTLLRGTTTINAGGELNAISGVDLEYNGSALLQMFSGHAVDDGVHLKATGGGDISNSEYIDVGNGNVGSLSVTGAGSTLTAGSISDWGRSTSASATVTIADSAVATVSQLRAGTSNGQFVGTVSGGALLKALASFTMGGGTAVRPVSLDVTSNGTLRIDGSATFNSQADLNLTNGTVNFNGGATFNVGSRIDWSGGTVNLGANTTLLVNGGVFNKTSPTGFIFTDNTTTRVTSGGSFTTPSYFDLGNATLEVDNGTLTAGTAGGTISDWGAASSSTVTLSNGAVATYHSGLRTSLSGGMVNATLSGGARLVTSSLATGGATTSNTVLTVNGGRIESSGAIDFLRGTTVSIAAGGYVEGENVALGSSGGTTGVTVAGDAAVLKALDELIAGRIGTSTLTISAGGRAESNDRTVLSEQGGANSTVTVTGSGSTLSVGSTLVVGEGGAATLNVQDQGYVAVLGSVTVNGSSKIDVSTNGQLEINSAAVISNEGEIELASGGLIRGDVSNGWHLRLQNADVFGDVTLLDGSRMFADNSSVSGLDQQAGAQMLFEIRGPSDFDDLSILGAASFAGDLVVSLADGFVPTVDSVFQILYHESRTGQFLNEDFTAAPLPSGLIWNVLYGTSYLTLEVIPGFATLIGDANGDCSVGAADYALWAAQFGQTGSGLSADFDGNGSVGAGDYALWAANFGKTCPPAGANHVPEPSSLPLLGLAGACLAAYARAGRRRRAPTR